MAVLNFDATQVELPAPEDELITEFVDSILPQLGEVRQAMTPITARVERKYELAAQEEKYNSLHGANGRSHAAMLADHSMTVLRGCDAEIEEFLTGLIAKYTPVACEGIPEHEIHNVTWRLAVALRKKIHACVEDMVAGVRYAKRTHVIRPAPVPTSGDPAVTSTLPKRGPGRPRKTAAIAPAVPSEVAEVVGAGVIDLDSLAESLGVTLD